ncbi:MAG: hypothetical protein ACRDPK_11065 [Carbonactinosporaceae bacterium]
MNESCLLAGDWLYPLAQQQGGVAYWTLGVDGGPLASQGGRGIVNLDTALIGLRAASLGNRRPVVAVGSNAAPGQLRQKFADRQVSDVVPLTRATVRGLTVGHSAHVSAAGYVPYIPLAAPEHVVSEFYVLWLDDLQLERLNETEPNYELVTVTGDRYPLTLDSGERVTPYGMYRGRWGALRLGSGSAPVGATTQEELFSLLLEVPLLRELGVPPSGDVQAVTRALVNGDRGAFRLALLIHGLSVADGLEPPFSDKD